MEGAESGARWEAEFVVTAALRARLVRATVRREGFRGLVTAVLWVGPLMVVLGPIAPELAVAVSGFGLVGVVMHMRVEAARVRSGWMPGQRVRSWIDDGDWFVEYPNEPGSSYRTRLASYTKVRDRSGIIYLWRPHGACAWWPREVLGDDGLASLRRFIGRPRRLGEFVEGPLGREWVVERWVLRRGPMLACLVRPASLGVVFYCGFAAAVGIRAGGAGVTAVLALSPVCWWVRDLWHEYRHTRWVLRVGARIRTSVSDDRLVEDGEWARQETPLTIWGKPRRIGGMWVLAPRHTHGASNVLPEAALSPEMVEAIQRASDEH